jgi:hypothetical protein
MLYTFTNCPFFKCSHMFFRSFFTPLTIHDKWSAWCNSLHKFIYTTSNSPLFYLVSISFTTPLPSEWPLKTLLQNKSKQRFIVLCVLEVKGSKDGLKAIVSPIFDCKVTENKIKLTMPSSQMLFPGRHVPM